MIEVCDQCIHIPRENLPNQEKVLLLASYQQDVEGCRSEFCRG